MSVWMNKRKKDWTMTPKSPKFWTIVGLGIKGKKIILMKEIEKKLIHTNKRI